jgi:uncharacterized protein (TIGR00725 family)
MRAPVLAIVGPGDAATPRDQRIAESLGSLAAGRGWVVMTGGIASGVMEAAARGARRAGGIVVGILPSSDRDEASPDLSLAVSTGLGQGRNNVIVLSSDALAVCGMSSGTAVEAALALRAARPLVFIAADSATREFFIRLAPPGAIHFVDTVEDAIETLATRLDQRG